MADRCPIEGEAPPVYVGAYVLPEDVRLSEAELTVELSVTVVLDTCGHAVDDSCLLAFVVVEVLGLAAKCLVANDVVVLELVLAGAAATDELEDFVEDADEDVVGDVFRVKVIVVVTVHPIFEDELPGQVGGVELGLEVVEDEVLLDVELDVADVDLDDVLVVESVLGEALDVVKDVVEDVVLEGFEVVPGFDDEVVETVLLDDDDTVVAVLVTVDFVELPQL